jgi:hypothetical protein
MINYFHRFFILYNIKKSKDYLPTLTHLPQSIANDPEFFIKMIETHKKAFPNSAILKRVLNIASPSLKNNEDFIEQVLSLTSMNNIEFASDSIKNNINVMSLVVSQKCTLAKFMGKELRSSLEFAYFVLNYSTVGNEMRLFEGKIQNNLELAKFSIKKYPKSYTYFSSNIKENSEILSIMKEHYKQYESHFSHLINRLKKDPEFVLDALRENPKIYPFIGKNLKDVVSKQFPVESLEQYILKEKLSSKNEQEMKPIKKIKL